MTAPWGQRRPGTRLRHLPQLGRGALEFFIACACLDVAGMLTSVNTALHLPAPEHRRWAGHCQKRVFTGKDEFNNTEHQFSHPCHPSLPFSSISLPTNPPAKRTNGQPQNSPHPTQKSRGEKRSSTYPYSFLKRKHAQTKSAFFVPFPIMYPPLQPH